MTFHFVYIFTNSNVEMYIFASQSLHLIDREYIYFTNWYIYTLIRKCKNLLNSFHFLFSSNSIIISFVQQTCLQKCFIPARKIIKKKTIIMLVKLELTIPFYNLILFIKNLTLKTRN